MVLRGLKLFSVRGQIDGQCDVVFGCVNQYGQFYGIEQTGGHTVSAAINFGDWTMSRPALE